MNLLFGNYYDFKKTEYSLIMYGIDRGYLNEDNFELVKIKRQEGNYPKE